MPVFSLYFPWEAGITVELSEIEQVGDSNVFGEYRGDHHYLSDEDLLDTDCPAAGKCIGLLTRVSLPSFVLQRGCPPFFVSSVDPEVSLISGRFVGKYIRFSFGTCWARHALVHLCTRKFYVSIFCRCWCHQYRLTPPSRLVRRVHCHSYPSLDSGSDVRVGQ